MQQLQIFVFLRQEVVSVRRSQWLKFAVLVAALTLGALRLFAGVLP